MTAEAFLCIENIVSTGILMRIMAGGTFHFAVYKAFAAFQQLELVSMHIQVGRVDFWRKLRQYKFSEGITRHKSESRP